MWCCVDVFWSNFLIEKVLGGGLMIYFGKLVICGIGVYVFVLIEYELLVGVVWFCVMVVFDDVVVKLLWGGMIEFCVFFGKLGDGYE